MLDDLRALAHKVDRKQLKSDVDDARWCGKQVVRFCVVPSFHDRFVVLNPGLPINTASDRVLRASHDRRLRAKITWSGDRIPSAQELDNHWTLEYSQTDIGEPGVSSATGSATGSSFISPASKANTWRYGRASNDLMPLWLRPKIQALLCRA
jgi:hypothetical protein